jgi:hypothetical protein
MTQEGKLRDIEITILGTFKTKSAGKNMIYGEGQGIINTKDGKDTATFRGYDIGQTKEQINASFRDLYFLSYHHHY